MIVTLERGLRAAMRDGTELVADLYRPAGPTRLPTLLRRTPYEHTDAPAGASLDATRLVTAGYNLLVQHVRGRHASAGRFTPYHQETEDGADTLDWIASQPWSDGRVAMIGRSYDGATQWLAARGGPSRPRAIAPHMTGSGFGAGWTWSGGAFQLGFCLHWVLADLVLPAAGDRPLLVAALDGIEDLYRRPWRALPLLSEHAPYYEEWLRHPEHDAYWQPTAVTGGGPGSYPPALNISGWYDIFLQGTLDNWAATRAGASGDRLVIGPWSHCVTGGVFPERRYGHRADESVLDVTGLHLDFFDRAMAGEPRPGAARPVRLFVMGEDRWRDFDDWPPPGAEPVRWFLRGDGAANTAAGDGGLSPRPPGDERPDRIRCDPRDPVPTRGGATLMTGMFVGADCGPLDQRPVEARGDVLCYTSEPLDAPLTVIGPVIAEVYLSSSAPDTDVTAKLVDVWPDGRAETLCDGVTRARYRYPGSDTPLAAGRVHRVQVRAGATANVFRRGHRIRVEIAGANFPRFDVNPQTGGDPLPLAEGPTRVAVNEVHHSRRYPSHLLFLTLPGPMSGGDR